MMLPQDRQKEIIKYLKEYRSLKIAELSEQLQVTRETIRKDLYDLEEKNLIKKVHGGAILNKTGIETKYASRKSTNFEEKKAIASEAASHVSDGDTVYIDYGTTTLLFVRELLEKKDITVVTNSIPIANELMEETDFEVIMLGGSVRKNERSLAGPLAYRSIQNLFVDIGVFGIAGVDNHAGFTNVHVGESEVSRQILQHSQKSIVLADHSKFGTVTMNKVADINEVDLLITDSQVEEAVIADLRTNGIAIIQAEVREGTEHGEINR